MKTTFYENNLADFHSYRKVRCCRKIITEIITVRKTVKLRNFSLVATFEVQKTSSRVKSYCLKKTLQK